MVQEKDLNQDMGSYYARRAPEFDRIYAKPERQPNLVELKERLSKQFEGLKVLEVACGTGYWTQYIARSAVSITATDYNREMLEIARTRDYGRCSVSFQRADAYQLPVFQERFEGAFAGFWWSHVPAARREEMIRALHARLPEKALVVWIDGRYVEGSSTPIQRRDAQGNTYQVRRLEDGSRHEVLKNYPSEAELRADFKPYSSEAEVILLDYFWLLRYRVNKGATAGLTGHPDQTGA